MSLQKSLNRADDFHIHLRQGKHIKDYVQACIPAFKRLLVMPNTLPPLHSVERLFAYQKEIQTAYATLKKSSTPLQNLEDLEVLMTFKVSEKMPLSTVEKLLEFGAIGGKIYPSGVTTHSEDGVSQIKNLASFFDLMQEHDAVVNIHAEHPDSFSLHREFDYLQQVDWIVKNFPKLRLVIEHISDRRTVDFVQQKGKNVAATITVHHLMFTLDHIIGDKLMPHHFCKPIAKFPEDLKAIQKVAFSNDPSFFLGTDSAPHLKSQKECATGCAGIFSSPVAIPLLLEIFEQAEKLDFLNPFISQFGADFYRLPQNKEILNYTKKPHTIPVEIAGVVPLRSNQQCQWTLNEQ